MADLNKDALKRQLVYAGTFGNLSTAFFKFTGSAADTDKIYFGCLPRGSNVVDVKAVFPACGAGTNLDIGTEAVDGAGGSATAFATDIDTATAGANRSAAGQYDVDEDMYVIGTVGGANWSAGDKTVEVIVFYEYRADE